MAKGQYIGSSSVAHKSKKMYLGQNNVARTIRKGYIGSGGVAHTFWSGSQYDVDECYLAVHEAFPAGDMSDVDFCGTINVNTGVVTVTNSDISGLNYNIRASQGTGIYYEDNKWIKCYDYYSPDLGANWNYTSDYGTIQLDGYSLRTDMYAESTQSHNSGYYMSGTGVGEIWLGQYTYTTGGSGYGQGIFPIGPYEVIAGQVDNWQWDSSTYVYHSILHLVNYKTGEVTLRVDIDRSIGGYMPYIQVCCQLVNLQTGYFVAYLRDTSKNPEVTPGYRLCYLDRSGSYPVVRAVSDAQPFGDGCFSGGPGSGQPFIMIQKGGCQTESLMYIFPNRYPAIHWYSHDGGMTWTQYSPSFLDNSNLVIKRMVSSGSTMLACVGYKYYNGNYSAGESCHLIFKSTDGHTWTFLQSFQAASSNAFNSYIKPIFPILSGTYYKK